MSRNLALHNKKGHWLLEYYDFRIYQSSNELVMYLFQKFPLSTYLLLKNKRHQRSDEVQHLVVGVSCLETFDHNYRSSHSNSSNLSPYPTPV